MSMKFLILILQDPVLNSALDIFPALKYQLCLIQYIFDTSHRSLLNDGSQSTVYVNVPTL